MNPRGTPENLKPWKPGQSGNPGGRPKDPLTALVREMLGKPGGKGKAKAENIARVASAIIEGAAAGNPKLIKELWDRLEGRVPLQVTGANGGPIDVRHRVRTIETRHHAPADPASDGRVVNGHAANGVGHEHGPDDR